MSNERAPSLTNYAGQEFQIMHFRCRFWDRHWLSEKDPPLMNHVISLRNRGRFDYAMWRIRGAKEVPPLWDKTDSWLRERAHLADASDAYKLSWKTHIYGDNMQLEGGPKLPMPRHGLNVLQCRTNANSCEHRYKYLTSPHVQTEGL